MANVFPYRHEGDPHRSMAGRGSYLHGRDRQGDPHKSMAGRGKVALPTDMAGMALLT